MKKVGHLGATQTVVSRKHEDQGKIAVAQLVLNRE